jgi:polyferredoxin
LRRVSQGLLLGLFLFLLLKTEFRGQAHAAAGDIRLPYPVSLFLQADPLAALTNALATGTLYRGLLWSLVILIPTLFLGRFFCGWICPFGTLNHFVSSFKSESKRGKQLLESNRYKPWQRLKYYVLLAVLVAALAGAGLAGLMDPISLVTRGIGLGVLPAFNYAVNATGERLYATDSTPLRYVSHAIHFLLSPLLSFKQPYFRQGLALGLVLFAFLAWNLRITRFWCRALCPLGALLGLVSRRAALGLEKRPAQCNDCRRCLLACQGADDPIPGATWRKAECHLCLNCVDSCPEGALSFRFFPDRKETRDAPDLRRRAAFAGIAAGAALVPALRSIPGLDSERNDRLIRPPGSLDEKNFLERCIRCGQCMKACPNNALHPAFAEAGLEGIWTPVVAPRIGYCEPSCVLCGQVCPTGAIWDFTAKAKGWVEEKPEAGAKPIRLGTAFYDRGRCLPWAMATECIVCEEWCPTSPKAIYLRPAEVAGADGQPKQVRQPQVDPERCVGCGACEYACPVSDRPAVYVTSIGESRSKANQIVMRRARPAKPAAPAPVFPDTGTVAGWTKGEIRTFNADSLWEYIDGGADRYLQAGFERVMACDYRFENRIDAVADVYAMTAPEGAAKIFARERGEGSSALSLGDGARNYGQSLVFRKGRHLVRLTAYQPDSGMPAALERLARAIGNYLN